MASFPGLSYARSRGSETACLLDRPLPVRAKAPDITIPPQNLYLII